MVDFNATAKGRPLKIEKDPEMVEYFEDKLLKEYYSPDAAVMALEREEHPFKITLCTRTIYNYIEKGYLGSVMLSDLPRQGKQSKRRYRSVRRRPIDLLGKSIEERAASINERTEFGHWEMDCIESGRGDRTALLTLVERMSRKTLIFKLTSQSQDQVIKALNQVEAEMGTETFKGVFKSITVDNGSELLSAKRMMTSIDTEETSYRTQIYYCHPYVSYERGTNEVINGHIRRFIPKGSSISDYSLRQIKAIEQWINAYPRRVLGGQSADQIFQKKSDQAAT